MSKVLFVFVALAFFVLGTTAPTLAQTAVVCQSTQTVVAGDTLSKIAQAIYNNPKAFPVIVAATNAQAQTDNSFHAIDDPNLIEVGWKLCIPAASSESAPSTDTSSPKLSGTVWKWTGSQFSDDKVTTPDDPNKYLVQFLPLGRVSIKADCNQVLGAYTTEGNQLTITPGPSTLVACPPGTLGDDFVRQLSNVSSYFFKDGKLILEFKFDSGSMTFAPSAPTGLAGTQWDVVSYNNGKQAVVSLIADTSITLNFGTDGRVSGNASCNNYTGPFDTSGDILHVGALATTFMLCHKPDGVMAQESQYLTALQSAQTYEIAGDTLTIRDGSGAMQVVAKQSAAAAGLAGTSWDVTNYNNGKEAVVSILNGTNITLDFGQDNRVTGSASCNNYSGEFTSADNTLKVGPLITTLRACTEPEGVMEQEAQYLAALQNSATYEIAGDKLTIRDASGAMQVVATRAKPVTLAGSKWSVTSVNNGNQGVVSLISGTEISLNFGTDGKVNGNASCNTYNGAFEATDETLKVGPLATTRRACPTPEGVMAQEQQYLTALQNAATYEISNNSLTIRDASGATQVVATKSEPASLSGTVWSVVNYNNGKEAVVSILADTKITLDFGTDGTVSGVSGCNNYTGTFESTDTTLKVGALASTLKLCTEPEGVMDQETQYLAALQNSATYDITNNTLTIRDASGAMQVVATR